MQLMDFTAAVTLIQAVVQQTHEDARRGDPEARAALADWQGRTMEAVTVTRRERHYARRGVQTGDCDIMEQETAAAAVERVKAARAEREANELERMAAARAAANAALSPQRDADERARREAQEARERARQARAQAEFDARHKAPALRAWVAQGGDAAEFERRWPDQAARIRMAESTRQTDEARQGMARRAAADW